MPGFIEADYENSIIELFQNMGYQYVYGPDLTERDFKSPLYDDVLNDFNLYDYLQYELKALKYS